ncbi:TetR family transcriptional regulator [Streptomyces sp. 3MP-14]|uniref:TetR family transcriptional regulator n=1 Tax=Streptomyces mimosae TaxID=2586635 RepID=A0A5N6AE70_9ACTN|nr:MULTISPECIES: TetR/AcrR family transcriptional regulator [Streptomyces]KAB8166951.1 TetR family transcriptional regulator [Streptomyces mimosae]KAB8176892.1 TetR family transcriptional regulator [Streptomyces sp. 3MP-14]
MPAPPASTDDPPPRRETSRRPGGRSARVRELVHRAVREQLVAEGFDALTVDAVAARSGVHRTTVYRRWRDVGGLLADVLDAAADDAWTPPDTGGLLGDLTALNEEVLAGLTEDPPITMALIAASFRSPDAARALRRFWDDRYRRCAALVGRAAARGELPGAGTDARALLVAATAPVYHQLALLRVPADPALPANAARAATLAATAGAFTLPADGQRVAG